MPSAGEPGVLHEHPIVHMHGQISLAMRYVGSDSGGLVLGGCSSL